jgi:phosphoribosyl 1,2-cyclic phosphate phosphodiesterase
MEITFLGTGAAWGLPELGCRCKVCETLRARHEERTRTSLLLRGQETILVDCGPDVRRQLAGLLDAPPDAILLTHSHGDHFLGLDELVSFRRIQARDSWRPIPTYATQETWARVEQVFGYLVGDMRLLERRLAVPGEPLEGIRTRVVPFSTYHGEVARGSVGYIVEEEAKGDTLRLLYTSDFKDVPADPPLRGPLHCLVIQSHWLHEPKENRPNHMSFQRALEFMGRWAPREVYLVHISEEYQVEGDPQPRGLKGTPPKDPLMDPRTGEPYPNPVCHEEWQAVVTRIAEDLGIPQRPVVAHDGMVVTLDPGRSVSRRPATRKAPYTIFRSSPF